WRIPVEATPNVDLMISEPDRLPGGRLKLQFDRFVFVRPPFGITFCREIHQANDHFQRGTPILAEKDKERTFVIKRRIHVIRFEVEAVVVVVNAVAIGDDSSLWPIE